MMVPSAVGMTTSVLVAMPPIARSPESKVTVLLDWLMVPRSSHGRAMLPLLLIPKSSQAKEHEPF